MVFTDHHQNCLPLFNNNGPKETVSTNTEPLKGIVPAYRRWELTCVFVNLHMCVSMANDKNLDIGQFQALQLAPSWPLIANSPQK